MQPFKDDRSVTNIGTFAVENGTRSIQMHGNLVIERDQRSLRNVRTLLKIFKDIESELTNGDKLPYTAVEETGSVDKVANPFRK